MGLGRGCVVVVVARRRGIGGVWDVVMVVAGCVEFGGGGSVCIRIRICICVWVGDAVVRMWCVCDGDVDV